MAAAAAVSEIRRSQRAEGPATVLGIGTANPPNCIRQEDYPDYYFRVTKSEHLTDLKASFNKLCKMTGPKRRFFYHGEELIDAHPEFLDRRQPSLDARMEIASAFGPELAVTAARKAIAKWGRPATDITHLVACSSTVIDCPGVDYRVACLLGLNPSVVRTMLHINGCSTGSAALRLAKEIAENNRGARVLVVSVELTISFFRGPDEETPRTQIIQSTFGDGAGAVIVGADPAPHPAAERPLFEMVAVSQAFIPGTDEVLGMQLREHGADSRILTKELAPTAASNIHRCLTESFAALGMDVQWNSLFWVVHPGMRSIMDHVEKALKLHPRKIEASRNVLRDYGNMFTATVIFVLDEERRRIEEEGEGGEWGVMLAFGPGFTIEIMIMRATANLRTKLARL